jgi:hypothetical protein
MHRSCGCLRQELVEEVPGVRPAFESRSLIWNVTTSLPTFWRDLRLLVADVDPYPTSVKVSFFSFPLLRFRHPTGGS